MIIKFKLFENDKIDFENMAYWAIYGNKYNAIDVLNKLIDQISGSEFNRPLIANLQHIIRQLKNIIDSNDYRHSNVTIIGFNADHFEFGLYNSEIDKNRITDELKSFMLKGELKVENGKLILDTLEADSNKYNL